MNRKIFILLFFVSIFQFGYTQNADYKNRNYINEYGRLRLDGTRLVDKNGNPVQLKGWSSHGWQTNWGDCHGETAVRKMKELGANVYRGLMYVEESGYNSNKLEFTQTTKDLIDLTAMRQEKLKK